MKLHPEQIEAKLASFIDVPYFITGMPDDRLGEQLVLFVEQEQPYELDINEEDMKVFKPYEFPRKIIYTPQFQRTNTGKIQRGQTLTKYLDTI